MVWYTRPPKTSGSSNRPAVPQRPVVHKPIGHKPLPPRKTLSPHKPLPPQNPAGYSIEVGNPHNYLKDSSENIKKTLETIENLTESLPKVTPSTSGQSSIEPSSVQQGSLQGSQSAISKPVEIINLDTSSCEISPELLSLWKNSKKVESEDEESNGELETHNELFADINALKFQI